MSEEQWLRMALLGFSALLSILVPSFWLLLAVHALLWLLWYTVLQRWYRSAAGPTQSQLQTGTGLPEPGHFGPRADGQVTAIQGDTITIEGSFTVQESAISEMVRLFWS